MASAESELAALQADILKLGKRYLAEAEHARAVGTSEVQFAATTAAAVIDVVLGKIAARRQALSQEDGR